jgi:hypothetical protein
MAAIAVVATFSYLALFAPAASGGAGSDAGIDADDARADALLGAFGPQRPELGAYARAAHPGRAGRRYGPRPHVRAAPPAPQ